MPSNCPGAYLRVSRVIGAKKKPRPVPAMMKGRMRSVYGVVAVITVASQPMPIACSATPMATIRRPPMRSESRPAGSGTALIRRWNRLRSAAR
jgi:hypothetical protein